MAELVWLDAGSAAAVDPATDVLYRSQIDSDLYGPGALTTCVVGSDSRLNNMGVSSLCVARCVSFALPRS